MEVGGCLVLFDSLVGCAPEYAYWCIKVLPPLLLLSGATLLRHQNAQRSVQAFPSPQRRHLFTPKSREKPQFCQEGHLAEDSLASAHHYKPDADDIYP